MSLGRIFVTFVLVFNTVVGCNRPQKDPVRQGNQKLVQLQSMQADLAALGVSLERAKDAGKADALNKPVDTSQWQKYSPDQLLKIEDTLKKYVSTVDQLLIIDAQKNVYIQNKDLVLARRDQAQALLGSLQEYLKQRTVSVQQKDLKS